MGTVLHCACLFETPSLVVWADRDHDRDQFAHRALFLDPDSLCLGLRPRSRPCGSSGSAAGFVVTSFGAGIARPSVVIPCGRARIFFCRSIRSRELRSAFSSRRSSTEDKNDLVPGRGDYRQRLVHGHRTSVLPMVARGSSIWITAAGVNGLFAISSLVPVQMRVGKTPSPVRRTLEVLEVVQEWRSSCAGTSVYPNVHIAARPVAVNRRSSVLTSESSGCGPAWAELGDFDRAESVLHDLESVPECDLPAYLARDALIQSAIASGRGRLDAASDLLDSAEVHFRSIGDLGGLVEAQGFSEHHCGFKEAMSPGRSPRSTICSRTRSPGVIRAPDRSSWSSLSAFVSASNAEAAAEILVPYEAIQRRRPSASRHTFTRC